MKHASKQYQTIVLVTHHGDDGDRRTRVARRPVVSTANKAAKQGGSLWIAQIGQQSSPKRPARSDTARPLQAWSGAMTAPTIGA